MKRRKSQAHAVQLPSNPPPHQTDPTSDAAERLASPVTQEENWMGAADDRRPGDRGWKPGPFTELRVHGVGNTALLRLLDDPHPRQVAGDDIAGFYRSRIDNPLILEPDLEDPPPESPCVDEVLPTDLSEPAESEEEPEDWRRTLRWTDVEAYDWGGFNTGGGWKAMWLFLLPFTLANVAGWLVAGRKAWGQRWVRLFAMGTSLLFITWLGALVIDLVALQCGWQASCYERQVWLEPYSWGIFSRPPNRIALALLVPLFATWLLWWWPGRRSHIKYESQSPQATTMIRQAATEDDEPDEEGPENAEDEEGEEEEKQEEETSLRNPNLWTRDSEVHLDALLHGIAILAALGGAVSWAHWSVKSRWYDAVFMALGVLILVVVASLVVSWRPFAGTDPGLSPTRVSRTHFLGRIAVAFMVLVIASSFIDRGYATVDWAEAEVAPIETENGPAEKQMPEGAFGDFLEGVGDVQDEAKKLSGELRRALFVANGLVLLVPTVMLFYIAFRTSDDTARRNRRLWGKWGPLVALLTGLAIAASLLAGAGLWLEEWLGDRPGEHLEALGVDRGDCGPDPDDPDDTTCALVRFGEEDVEDLDTVQDRLETLIVETDDETLLPVLAHTAQTSQPRESLLSQPVIHLPEIYDLAAVGFFAMLASIALLAGILEARLRISLQKDMYPVRQGLCELAGEKLEDRSEQERRAWTNKGVREMRKSPRLTRIHHLLWVPALFMVGSGLFLLLDGLLWDFEKTELLGAAITARAAWALTWSRWLIITTIVFVATMVYRSYKPEAQESFGGIWDVVSFLPRHYHPFAIPSYGVRAVPELAQRIKHLCTREDAQGGCLVSAHSGGVVISLAAIALLDSATQRRVSLLTYGSPTGALYGRAYPEYFDTKRLVEDVAHHLGDSNDPPDPTEIRWYNLWRLTDWTGGYSFGPQRDRFKEYRCSDSGADSSSDYPLVVGHIERIQYDPSCRALMESKTFDPVPKAIGHTDYLHDPKHTGPEDPRYQNARGALVGMMT